MTAIVGRLRPQVRVVDVDLEGARGDAAVELVAAWCRQKDLWHLVRPSGGGHGRAHVFVAVDELAAELEIHVAQIREQLRGTRRALDVRDTVRPLSSPTGPGQPPSPSGTSQRLFWACEGTRGRRCPTSRVRGAQEPL